MNRKKVQKAGFIFGVWCRRIGAMVSLICLSLSVNETYKHFIEIRFLIPAIIAVAVFIYGVWRTGGICYDEY